MQDNLKPDLPFNDSEWQKQRKKAWKDIKKRIDSMDFRKEEKKAIKDFFFTGVDSYYEKPNHGPSFTAPALLDIWFFWAEKPDVWPLLFKKWVRFADEESHLIRHARDTFIKISLYIGHPGSFYLPDSEESFFGGLEEQLYKFFYPQGRYAFYLQAACNEEQEKAEHIAAAIGIPASINEYFRTNIGNPYNLVNFGLDDWIAAQDHGFDAESGMLKNLFCEVDMILENPDQQPVAKVDLANRINAIVAEKAPPYLVDLAAEVRARPNHPELFSELL